MPGAWVKTVSPPSFTSLKYSTTCAPGTRRKETRQKATDDDELSAATSHHRHVGHGVWPREKTIHGPRGWNVYTVCFRWNYR